MKALARGVAAAAVFASSFATRAEAQSVTLDPYRAPELATDGLTVSRPDDAGHLRLSGLLALDYGLHPLVYQPSLGSSTDEELVVEHQLVAHFGVALGLFDRLVIFAGVPVDLLQSGAPPTMGSTYAAADGAGLGDLWLGARVRLFGERSDVFALAASVNLSLPSSTWANATQHYTGERGATVHPELLGEVRFGGGFRLTANLGARLRLTDEARLQTLPVSHELTWALGLTLPIVRREETHGVGLDALVEAYGAATFDQFGSLPTSPIEGLIGLRVEPLCGLFVGLAGGPGLTRGYGAADFRGLLTVGFADAHCAVAPPPVVEEVAIPLDTDGDGLVDARDGCPLVPEDPDGFEDDDGCPEDDNDRDGVLDASDGCPLVPEDLDEFEDTDGCPDPDNDHDGLLDPVDECPLAPEDVDGFEDADGCTDPDNDRDTVPDAEDECPLAPGLPADRGCPRAVRLDVETGTIVVLQRVEFATGRDVILERSFPILEEVRAILAANPQIARVRIEGHTDDRGRDATNMQLSARRARSVLRWLAEHGIEGTRLVATGCGELHPAEPNATADGRQANRRVEFHIVDPAPLGGARVLEGCTELAP